MTKKLYIPISLDISEGATSSIRSVVCGLWWPWSDVVTVVTVVVEEEMEEEGTRRWTSS